MSKVNPANNVLQVEMAGSTASGSEPNSTVVQATGPLTMTHTAVSATGSTGVLLAANTARRYAILINDGTVDVYIKFTAVAALNQGIRIIPNGGNYEMSPALGNLTTAAINVIAVSGTANVLVTEGV